MNARMIVLGVKKVITNQNRVTKSFFNTSNNFRKFVVGNQPESLEAANKALYILNLLRLEGVVEAKLASAAAFSRTVRRVFTWLCMCWASLAVT